MAHLRHEVWCRFTNSAKFCSFKIKHLDTRLHRLDMTKFTNSVSQLHVNKKIAFVISLKFLTVVKRFEVPRAELAEITLIAWYQIPSFLLLWTHKSDNIAWGNKTYWIIAQVQFNCIVCKWVLLRRDRDRDILARLRFGHQLPLNRRCPDEKYQYVNNNRLTEYPGTPAWTPVDTRDLLVAGVQAGVDTCDLVVAGVRISISPKYLYLYLELSGSTFVMSTCLSISNYSQQLSCSVCPNTIPGGLLNGLQAIRGWQKSATLSDIFCCYTISVLWHDIDYIIFFFLLATSYHCCFQISGS